MFKTLIEGHDNIEQRFKKNILKNFGPGSKYWKNLKLRKKYKEEFKAKHDVGLGFMSFFTKAVVYALKEFPDVHSMIDGDHQIKFDFYFINIFNKIYYNVFNSIKVNIISYHNIANIEYLQ